MKTDAIAIMATIIVSSNREFNIPPPTTIRVRRFSNSAPATIDDVKHAVGIARLIYEEASKKTAHPPKRREPC